jgi:hypothetical protein
MDQGQAMFFVANAWLKVKPATIKNCWRLTNILAIKEGTTDGRPVEYPTTALPLEEEITAELNGMLSDLPGNDNGITNIEQLDLETDETNMMMFHKPINMDDDVEEINDEEEDGTYSER